MEQVITFLELNWALLLSGAVVFSFVIGLSLEMYGNMIIEQERLGEDTGKYYVRMTLAALFFSAAVISHYAQIPADFNHKQSAIEEAVK